MKYIHWVKGSVHGWFLPAATERWPINAVSPPPSSPPKTIEHGSIETNELNMSW